jgi:hypothetical protein
MKAKKSNRKYQGIRRGVGHLFWHVLSNNPDVAVRLENGETMSVEELKNSSDGTWKEVILTGDISH